MPLLCRENLPALRVGEETNGATCRPGMIGSIAIVAASVGERSDILNLPINSEL